MRPSELVGSLIGSPYYWGLVAAITLAFAVIDLNALSHRTVSRWHGMAVAVYAAVWVILLGLALPIAPLGSLWWLFPATVRIAMAVMFGGGQLLAGAVREEQLIIHPERRPRRFPKRRLSAAELRAAEEFDAKWQLEDRERNRERELHARKGRERHAR